MNHILIKLFLLFFHELISKILSLTALFTLVNPKSIKWRLGPDCIRASNEQVKSTYVKELMAIQLRSYTDCKDVSQVFLVLFQAEANGNSKPFEIPMKAGYNSYRILHCNDLTPNENNNFPKWGTRWARRVN